MDLSVNPLPTQQTKFLKSESGLLKENINKSQYRTDIVKHLYDSMLYFHHILPYSVQLKKEKIYDVLNAQTLENFLQNCLKNGEEGRKKFVYDFRTVELARLFFEISVSYLEQNPSLLNQDSQIPTNVREGIRDISEYFAMLAKTNLQSESNVTLNQKRQKQILDEVEQIKQKINQLQKGGTKYDNINRKHSLLSDQQIQLDNDFHQLRSELASLEGQRKVDGSKKQQDVEDKIKKIENLIKRNREKREPIAKEIYNLQEEREKIMQPLYEKRSKLYEELKQKYAHLWPYFSRIKRLSDFNYIPSPHNLEEHYGL